MKQRIEHLTALLCALVLALSLCPAALAAGVTPTVTTNTGKQSYDGNWSSVIGSYLYPNAQGGA